MVALVFALGATLLGAGIVLIALVANTFSGLEIGRSRKHLQPIPIELSACPYVR